MRSISRLMLAGSLALAVGGCVTAGPIVADAGPCSDLLPGDWDNGVEGAEVPAEAPPEPADLKGKLDHALAEVKKWAGFGVESDVRREMANGRYRDAKGIIQRCEKRNEKATSRARPKVLGVF